MDTIDDQTDFAGKHDFRFPLVADPHGEICKAYGAFKEDWGVAGRATAIVGEDGVVLKTYPRAPLGGAGHAQEVLDDLRGIVGG